MPGGRPSKYEGQVTIEKALAYINKDFQNEELVPTIEGLSLVLGVSRKTVHEWANDERKPEFGDILEMCNAKQARMLMSGALGNDLNANIAKLMLGKQGYSEKSIQEVTGPGGGPIGPIVLQPVIPASGDEAD